MSEKPKSKAPETEPPPGSAEELREQLGETESRLVRTAADLENYRRRSRRELDETRKYSALELMRDLLPVVDNLERAILAARHSGDFDSLLEGVQLVQHQLLDTLRSHGLNEIGGDSEPFDPNFHHAVSKQPSDQHDDGEVIKVVQPGYRLHDRVIRPSRVMIAGGQSDDEPSSKGEHS